MGEVIQGPWKWLKGPDLREQLEHELHKLQQLLAEVRQDPPDESGGAEAPASGAPRQDAVKLDSL
jgi:hypothetical protein